MKSFDSNSVRSLPAVEGIQGHSILCDALTGRMVFVESRTQGVALGCHSMAFQAGIQTMLALRAGNIALTSAGNGLNSFFA